MELIESLRSRFRRDGDPGSRYQRLYEAHAAESGDDGIGGGDYDEMGDIQLAILRDQGLTPAGTLLDFGCGNGRLAVHAVRYLTDGSYVGTDISPTFLGRARRRIDAAGPGSAVRLLHQHGEAIDVDEASVDMVGAFSVFTHLEHEDMFRCLGQFARVVRPGGLAVISCLPMDLEAGRAIFWGEARITHEERWSRVRNVATTVDFMDAIADFAGWEVVRWLPGDAVQTSDGRRLGQSVQVLRRSDKLG